MRTAVLAASTALALALAAGTASAATTVFTQSGETGLITSPGSVGFTFNSPQAGGATANFDLLGYLSLDGANSGGYDDVFTLSLNGTALISGSYVLGGGGNNQTFFQPAGSTITPTSNGLFNGGLASISTPLTLIQGSNTLTFAYASGIPEGAGNEGFGIRGLAVALNPVSNVPEPATWAMMIGGFGMVGASMRYRRRQPKVSFATA